MVIKSIIGKFKSRNKKSNDSIYIGDIELRPVDNIVDDFFSEIDNAGDDLNG